MKIRSSFVSNSSSASFIVAKAGISKLHYDMLEKKAQEEGWFIIDESPHFIEFTTMMDNYDMEWYCGEIGIPAEAIGGYSGDN